MATCKDTTGIVPVSTGRARVKNLDINFTSMSEIKKNFAFGNDIVDADTNLPVQLPGKPTFDNVTLTSPYTYAAIDKLNKWLDSSDACPNKVSFTVISGNRYTTFTGCSLLSYPLALSFDANSDTTTANFITIVLSVNSQTVTKLEQR